AVTIPVAVAVDEVDGPAGKRPHRLDIVDVAAVDDELHAPCAELHQCGFDRIDPAVRIAQYADFHARSAPPRPPFAGHSRQRKLPSLFLYHNFTRLPAQRLQ